MVFASLTFLCFFLPLNLILYYLSENPAYRNLLLIFFSLSFYAWGEPVWVVLLIFSALIDYANGLWIDYFRGRRWAVLGVWSSVFINLSLLGVFKYSGFLYENLNALLGWQLTVPKFSLPVGISFYTFQTISYSIDVYRGELKAQKSFLKFLLFVSLYHQLVAGPIVRYADIAHEIDHRRSTWRDINTGIHRFCIGLFKKVCLANVAGELASKYLDSDLGGLALGEAWLGIILFSLQIYFDFSGYSDMAIGLGRMFGFHYHENFMYPYVARSATEFWRRWHISLGSFFRDYVYIPLGGRKRRPYFNLFVVWLLTGLWHGASWNFVLWGLYFGLLIGLERAFLLAFLQKLPAFVRHAYLLFAVVIGWALFYFEDIDRLQTFFQVLFGAMPHQAWTSLGFLLTLRENAYWLLLSLILCLPVYPWLSGWFTLKMKYSNSPLPWVLVTGFQFLLLLLSITLLVGNTYNPFIYYRF
ncbi:MAG: MBOAT family protein [Microscillaceae bacterium]|nr:MBOAT family protein [Microscillaceae bacterium]